LPNDKGRLHVTLRLATSKDLKDEVMVFDLTVRGFASGNMSEWFGMAHEWIVKGFADLTNDTIQTTIWKRK
jgi:hypothetical protein